MIPVPRLYVHIARPWLVRIDVHHAASLSFLHVACARAVEG